jgi:hypothetical protein
VVFRVINLLLCVGSWVASHDPVGVEDRQITLLESLSVNMEQVRAAVTAVNEQLAAEQGNFGPRPGNHPFCCDYSVSRVSPDPLCTFLLSWFSLQRLLMLCYLLALPLHQFS